jgi:HSP20 family protein
MAQSSENVPVRRRVLSEFDPFRDLLRPSRVSRLLNDPWFEDKAIERWAPAMDVGESKDAYTITLEVPGAKKEDITIECHDGVLTVKGHKQNEREEHDEHRHYAERSYGSFSRSVRLPAEASEQISASYKEGVLTIAVQKQEERKPRVVSIKD